jgi:plastocyanin
MIANWTKIRLLTVGVGGLAALVSAAAFAGGHHTVSQKAKAFSTAELEVKVGDTVEFKNDDDVAHNVFSVSKPQPFNTKVQTPGKSADITFAKEGTVEVRCAIHPQMKLLIKVTK